MAFCPNCGNANVSDSAAFCSKCGCNIKEQYNKIPFQNKHKIADNSKSGNIGIFSKKKFKIIAIISGMFSLVLVVSLCLFGLYRKAVLTCEDKIYKTLDEADEILEQSIENSLYDFVYNDLGVDESDKMNALIDRNVDSAMDSLNAGRRIEISDLKLRFSECTVEISASNASLDSGIKDILTTCIYDSFDALNIIEALYSSYSEDSYQYVNNLFDILWTSLRENREDAPKIKATETIRIKKVDGEWRIENEDDLEELLYAYIGISELDQEIMDSLDAFMSDLP